MATSLSELDAPTQTGAAFSLQFLFRSATLSFGALAPLSGADSLAALAALAVVQRAWTEERELVSARLFEAIASAPREVRNDMLGVRRALYNGRTPRKEACERTLSHVTPAVAALARTCERFAQDHAAAERAVLAAHAGDTARARKYLKTAVRGESFLRSLTLSSESLVRNVERYATAERSTAREEQIERGLLRYFTRAAGKATPFASFCAIGAGSFCNQGQSPFAFAGSPGRIRTVLRPNRRLYHLLWQFIQRHPELHKWLFVERNPSLVAEARQYRFLALVNGREAFQRLERSEALDIVLEMARTGEQVRFEDLARTICASPEVEATAEEADAFLLRLITIGVVRFAAPVSHDEPEWTAPLGRLLEASAHPHAGQLRDLLVDLDARISGLATTVAGAWPDGLGALRQSLRDGLTAVGISREELPEPPVYEDAGTAASLRHPTDGSFSAAMSTFQRFACLGSLIAWPRAEMATLRHHFDSRYTEGARVPLLQFYEESSRGFLKDHLARERRPERGDGSHKTDAGNPFNLLAIAKMRMATGALANLFRDAWAGTSTDCEAVSVGLDEIAAVLSEVPAHASTASVSAFCQLIPPLANEDGMLLVPDGRFYVGFGKYYSRFLHLLPELCDNIQAENAARPGVRFAEIAGEAGFNGNMHPKLLPFEISSPTGAAGSDAEALDCATLDVAACPKDAAALMLVHRPTGERVVPIDVGFLNSRLRPPLFRLLTRFQPPCNFGLVLPQYAGVTGAEAERGIRVRPRLLINDVLIVARRTWFVPCESFPLRSHADTAVQYFTRLHAWREAHGVPMQVFVRIHAGVTASVPAAVNEDPDAAVDTEEGKTAAVDLGEVMKPSPDSPVPDRRAELPRKPRPSRDLRKPQYIDFSSPLLADLFGRLPGALAKYVAVIEEQLPGPMHLPASAGDAHATEWVFQWNIAAGAES